MAKRFSCPFNVASKMARANCDVKREEKLALTNKPIAGYLQGKARLIRRYMCLKARRKAMPLLLA